MSVALAAEGGEEAATRPRRAALAPLSQPGTRTLPARLMHKRPENRGLFARHTAQLTSPSCTAELHAWPVLPFLTHTS